METSSWRSAAALHRTEGCVVGVGELTGKRLAVPAQLGVSATVALKSCKAAKLQSCKAAKLQSCKAAKLQSCKAAMFCALLVINLMRWTTPDGIDVPSSGR